MKSSKQRVHIIAMGGSVMHALAIAISKKGIKVTGSDDNFFDPSRSRLEAHGLLPESPGWFPEHIDKSIDTVILGMHAHADNPELLKAGELGLNIISLPQFIYQQSIEKERIVIGGSHGKTTITSMIMHVLRHCGREFDYVVGAKVEGFDETVKLTDAPIIVIEGDEYLSSRIDPTPKFLHYQHTVGLISGIAWDHVNVFPTEEAYVNQFELFAAATPEDGVIIYNVEDSLVAKIGQNLNQDISSVPYSTHQFEVIDGKTFLIDKVKRRALKIFGQHNMINLSGAKEIVSRLGIQQDEFYEAIESFELPSMRLDVLKSGDSFTVFRDYAHAPSKVRATSIAVKSQYPERALTGIFELHTYSSLNRDFFDRYSETLKYCNEAIVFYNPKAVAQKRLPDFSPEDVKKAFNHPNLEVINDPRTLKKKLDDIVLDDRNLLFMSSSNFGELDLASMYN